MVFVKFGIILLFVLVGIFYVKPTNWQPFIPYGFSGVFSGAALVFFAFLGFDAVSMAAEEVKNPKKIFQKDYWFHYYFNIVIYCCYVSFNWDCSIYGFRGQGSGGFCDALH